MPKKMLTPPEIAKEYGFDACTVRNWIRSGKLKAKDKSKEGAKVPRFVIRPEWLEQFLTSDLVKPDEAATTHKTRRDKNVEQYF